MHFPPYRHAPRLFRRARLLRSLLHRTLFFDWKLVAARRAYARVRTERTAHGSRADACSPEACARDGNDRLFHFRAVGRRSCQFTRVCVRGGAPWLALRKTSCSVTTGSDTIPTAVWPSSSKRTRCSAERRRRSPIRRRPCLQCRRSSSCARNWRRLSVRRPSSMRAYSARASPLRRWSRRSP